jgi:hypothetical protein
VASHAASSARAAIAARTAGSTVIALGVRVEALAIARTVAARVVSGLYPNANNLFVSCAKGSVVALEPIVLVVLAVFELDHDVRKLFARGNMYFVALEPNGNRPGRATSWTIQTTLVGISVIRMPIGAITIWILIAVIGRAFARAAGDNFESVRRGIAGAIGGTSDEGAEKQKQTSFQDV